MRGHKIWDPARLIIGGEYGRRPGWKHRTECRRSSMPVALVPVRYKDVLRTGVTSQLEASIACRIALEHWIPAQLCYIMSQDTPDADVHINQAPVSDPDGVSDADRRTEDRGDAKTTSCGCMHQKSVRNLVVCIDGTSNQFGVKNTNVVELYNRLEKSENQLTYYNSGIGTYATPSWRSLSWWMQVAGHKFDLAFAWRFERILLGAYEWLSENYNQGDRIYLFVSRGAYQVRAISGMIERVGLIHKGNRDQIPFAYELYAATKHPSDTDSSGNTTIEKCKRFKATFSRRNVKVHFVGVWDTVSSVGIVRDKTLPDTTAGMGHVCYFRHALALDERRVKFLPEYAYGGVGPPTLDDNHMKEVWFAGSHSDIGGGKVENSDMNQFGPAIRWMSYEAIGYGLKVEPFQGKWKNVTPSRSLSLLWWFLEVFPITRLTYKDSGSVQSWPPNMGAPRCIQAHQLIHKSVRDQYSEGQSPRYIPIARFYDGRTWDDWQTNPGNIPVEDDPYMSAIHAIAGLKDDPSSSNHLDVLAVLLSTESGRRSIQETPDVAQILFNALEAQDRLDPHTVSITTTALSDCLVSVVLSGLENDPDSEENLNVLYSLLSKDIWRQSVQSSSVMAQILITVLNNQCEPVHCNDTRISDFMVAVVLSELKKNVNRQESLSILDDLRDTERGFTSLQHKDTIATLSGVMQRQAERKPTDDASRIVPDVLVALVLASIEERPPPTTSINSLIDLVRDSRGREALLRADDSTQRIFSVLDWVVDGIENEAERLKSTRTVVDVLNDIVPDAWRVKKHSVPKLRSIAAILLGGSKTDRAMARKFVLHFESAMTMEPLIGHADDVNSVVFSPQGDIIASGSDDTTVRLWSPKNGLPSLSLLTGHKAAVNSVAFSPDGERIASGSRDGTIRIWDVKTGSTTGDSIKGETPIFSVAFSHDGRRVAYGSKDAAIRIWDVETSKIHLEILHAHEGPVHSVAFSPDDHQISSGSGDGKARTWNAETGGSPITTFSSHTNLVLSVSYHPKLARIVSGSADCTVRIWDTGTTDPVTPHPLTGHSDWVRSAVFSLDGALVVSGADDSTIRVWDAETGQMVAGPFSGHDQEVAAVAFSPDNKRVVSGSFDNTVRIWDATGDSMLWIDVSGERRDGATVRTETISDSLIGTVLVGLKKDPSDAMQLSMLHRLQSTVSGRRSLRTARIEAIEVMSAAMERQAKSEKLSPEDAGIIPTILAEMVLEGLRMELLPKELETSYILELARIRNTEHGRAALLSRTSLVQELLQTAELIIKRERNQTERLNSIREVAQTLNTIAQHTEVERMTAQRVKVVGSILMNGSRSDRTLADKLMEDFASAMLMSPLIEHSQPVWSVTFSNDGQHVASGSSDGTVCVWNASTGKMASNGRGQCDYSVRSIAFSPSDKYIAIATEDTTAMLWEWRTGKPGNEDLQLRGHEDSVCSITFSRNGRWIASGAEDRSIILWDAETLGMKGQPLRGHTSPVQSVAFSHDGSQIASGSRDNTVRLWNVITGQEIRTIEGHTGSVYSVTFSPDSRRIISSSRDRTIRIWDADTGALVVDPLTGHDNWVDSVAIAHDGQRLVSGSDDTTIRIWDTETGEQVDEPLTGHTGPVNSVAISPDGQTIASGSVDRSVRIWDATGGWRHIDEISKEQLDNTDDEDQGKKLNEENDEPSGLGEQDIDSTFSLCAVRSAWPT
ncbi:hypothetical protein CERSUDRAFT_155454 [Gelatoporia subvermispora B]|uniref:T6SS Phospholipase effector Tle1-like catalytic domain-containing protein n=1 Tax=Ceriporiopsis subvermispora (strain B) TaxID=914234 RepID=M2QY08_CERS8|nr:hypothetical protein CERSUDRAFT_155454 [Gelatoporia subvermispora B]